MINANERQKQEDGNLVSSGEMSDPQSPCKKTLCITPNAVSDKKITQTSPCETTFNSSNPTIFKPSGSLLFVNIGVTLCLFAALTVILQELTQKETSTLLRGGMSYSVLHLATQPGLPLRPTPQIYPTYLSGGMLR